MEIKKIKIAQCLLVLLWCIVQTAGAQKENKKLISGYVADSFTKEHLVNSKVELLLPDSTVLDSTKTYYYTYGKNPQSIFEFYVIKGGKYILRYSHRGYETNCVNIEATFYKRKDWFSVGTIYLKKKPKDSHQLNEVTVTATKIKFYMKGDTIIYNADAFQLSEGSMLDALIAQLPGVQLKEDGRIYINGKFVNSLLLNGKDFFRNDRKELLDNLPYYMVKSIKVYDKQSEFSKFIGRDTGDKELVMDVNLKPEYSIGWIANVETGIGSKDRYLGRFFALRFTRHSRLSAFGNMNNLNENRTPGRNGEWSSSNINNGLIASKVAGIDYNVENKEGNFTLNGNAKIEHSNSDNSTVTNSVNFLTGGDTYERSQSLSHSENTQINTNHSMTFTRGIIYMTLSPSLSYRKYHSNSSSLSGSFSEDPANYISNGLLDSLSTLYAGSILRRIAINRTQQNSLRDGHSFRPRLDFRITIRDKKSSDYITLSGNASYSYSKDETFTHYRLDYPSSSSASGSFQNQYSHAPNRNYQYNLRVDYSILVPDNLSISPYYQYTQNYNSQASSFYRLDQLNGWGETDLERELGTLPSTTDSLQLALDKRNSIFSREYYFIHEIGTVLRWNITRKSGSRLSLGIPISLRMQKNRLIYQQATMDTTFSRHILFFDPSIRVKWDPAQKKYDITFNYNCRSSAPSMSYLLNVRNDSNPLNVRVGNPNLKNTHTQQFELKYNGHLDGQKMLNVNLNYTVIQNSQTMGYVYNKSTGVRTSMPDNINGNWTSSIDVNFSSPLDKAKRLNFSTSTNAFYANNVDLVSVSGSTASSRSTVGSLRLNENLRVDYQISPKVKIGTKIKGAWTHATSARENFTTINAGDFNYGLTGQVELPWNMQFSTDLTEYSRRGYENHSMNTNELVWDARLAKRILHGNLTFMLDGFDILGNLSNVRRTINAQGRTESYYNVIPSYVMLHAIYRLNIQPKKK